MDVSYRMNFVSDGSREKIKSCENDLQFIKYPVVMPDLQFEFIENSTRSHSFRDPSTLCQQIQQ